MVAPVSVAVDVDDVLADYTPNFIKWHNKRHGTDFKLEDIHTFHFASLLGCTREEAIARVDEFQTTEEFRRILPILNSQAGISLLSKYHELHIITSRIEKIRSETNDWITKYFSNLFSGIHFSSNVYRQKNGKTKAQICSDLGIKIMIEDSIDYAFECASQNVQVLLIDKPWNRNGGKNHDLITRVNGWETPNDQYRNGAKYIVEEVISRL